MTQGCSYKLNFYGMFHNLVFFSKHCKRGLKTISRMAMTHSAELVNLFVVFLIVLLKFSL